MVMKKFLSYQKPLQDEEEDNPKLDSLINEIFCDANVRTQIKKAAEEGNAKTLADAIGLT